MAYDSRSLDDYVDVAERIQEFRDKHPEGTLRGTWELLTVGEQVMLAYRAEAFRAPDDQAPGVGCAWELVPGRTPYTRGSELQNAETSAWGRAIIAVGAADSKRGIASRQEVMGARDREAERLERAQRNAPPEVDAGGAATFAEQTRMVRGREPGVERLGTTPVDDGFYDQQPEDRPGTSNKDQRRGIYMALGRHGIKDFQAAIERVCGRNITEPADMSFNEAIMVKARVDSWDGRTEELLAPLTSAPKEAAAG